MKLATAYSEVIRYGITPPEDVANWINQQKEAGDTQEGSHPDFFFADYLQDRDDPRHTLVRKDLSYRPHAVGNLIEDLKRITGSPDPYMNPANTTPETETTTHSITPTSDGEFLKVKPHYGPKGVGYRVDWTPKGKSWGYSGALTHEEFADFLKDYGADQKIEDFK